MKLFLAVIFACMAISLPLTGTELAWPERAVVESLRRPNLRCLMPNELRPSDMMHVTHKLAAGDALIVGTERGLFAMVLHPQLHRLFLLDSNASAFVYNKINIALLAAAQSFAQFYSLKFAADRESLRSHLGPEISDAEIAWFANYRRMRITGLSALNDPSNYNMEHAGFMHLQAKARAGELIPIWADLGSPQSLQRLVRHPRFQNSVLSLIDLSNTWWDGYAGLKVFPSLRGTLEGHLRPTSRWILTHYKSLAEDADWGYFALEDQFIRSKPDLFEGKMRITSEYPHSDDEGPALIDTFNFGPACEADLLN